MKIYFIRSLSLFLALLFSLALFTSCAKKPELTSDTREMEESGSAGETQTDSNIVKLTFPEGYSISRIALKLEENGVCGAQEFRDETNKTEYLTEYGFDIPNPADRAFLLEGYLFPDTYEFLIGENPSSVLKKFLDNTKSKLTSEIKSRASQLGYSVDEIITLASIVQRESGGSDEAKRVSSVIHNRLDSPSFPKLQCDATISYLKESIKPYIDDGDVYYTYCENYNTYMCKGLPAGAINNPGMAAINAALYPEDTPYYYFVTDSEGVYHYSESWEEHSGKVSQAGL